MKWVFLFYLIALNTICAKGIFLGRKAILCLTLLFGFCIWFFYFASLRRLFNWFFRLWPSREYFAWYFNIASNGHFFTNFHHFPIRLEFSSGFLVVWIKSKRLYGEEIQPSQIQIKCCSSFRRRGTEEDVKGTHWTHSSAQPIG